MTDVELSQQANRAFQNLDPDNQDQVRERLFEVAGFSDPSRSIKPLQGRPGGRIRAGDYRAIVEYDQADDTIYVLEIDHQSNVYD